MSTVTIQTMVDRWSSSDRPLFKGKLIDPDGCKCAQGDVLFCSGYTDEQLRKMKQSKADRATAEILGISVTHSVLLRQVNDSKTGSPQVVLTHPEQILGDKAALVLVFWLYLDGLSSAAGDAAREAAGDAAREAAGAAAWAAGAAAREAATTAAWAAATTAAWAAGAEDMAWASNEIQGMDLLIEQGRAPYFLAFFGLDTWDKVRGLIPEVGA
jgi:hypothetical protein